MSFYDHFELPEHLQHDMAGGRIDKPWILGLFDRYDYGDGKHFVMGSCKFFNTADTLLDPQIRRRSLIYSQAGFNNLLIGDVALCFDRNIDLEPPKIGEHPLYIFKRIGWYENMKMEDPLQLIQNNNNGKWLLLMNVNEVSHRRADIYKCVGVVKNIGL